MASLQANQVDDEDRWVLVFEHPEITSTCELIQFKYVIDLNFVNKGNLKFKKLYILAEII